jgi:hypothetical protein
MYRRRRSRNGDSSSTGGGTILVTVVVIFQNVPRRGRVYNDPEIGWEEGLMISEGVLEVVVFLGL